jgi:hypothetical protein
VIYVGSERGYVGVYNALLQPIAMPGDSGDVALRVLGDIGEAWRLDSQHVVNRCLSTLAEIVVSADGRARRPGALIIGLPAALSLDNRYVQGDAAPAWTEQLCRPIAEGGLAPHPTGASPTR